MSTGQNHRKHWQKRSDSAVKIRAEEDRTSKDVSPAYEQYLTSLQHKNRLMKKMKKKDDKQLEKEKREQGFVLYINGANLVSKFKPQAPPPRQNLSRVSSRARTAPQDILKDTDWVPINFGDVDQINPERVKSAPAKHIRKGWSQQSIEIKAETGEPLHAPANRQIPNPASTTSATANDANQSSSSQSKADQVDEEMPSDNDDDVEDEITEDLGINQLRLSYDDLKTLRRSLEADANIRASLHEEIEEEIAGDDADDDHEIETDEDIEETIEESVDDTPVVKSSEEPPVQIQDRTFLLDFSSSVRRSKQLSVARKKTESTYQTKDDDDASMTSAKKEEYQSNIGDDIKREDDQQDGNTNVEKSTSEVAIQATSEGLTSNTLHQVVDKVKQLHSSQQRRLLRMLSKLGDNPSLLSVYASTSASQNDYTNNDEELVENASFKVVTLEILSNWGHPDKLGMTEVQFYDDYSNKLIINNVGVILQGEELTSASLPNITNGKTKTIKTKYMWSIPYKKSDTLVLHFSVMSSSKAENFILSKVMVWNYNKSLKDLNIGVKDARIFVDDILTWEGVLEKGCGNQVFEYGQTINLVTNVAMPNLKIMVENDEFLVNEDNQRKSQISGDVLSLKDVRKLISKKTGETDSLTGGKSSEIVLNKSYTVKAASPEQTSKHELSEDMSSTEPTVVLGSTEVSKHTSLWYDNLRSSRNSFQEESSMNEIDSFQNPSLVNITVDDKSTNNRKWGNLTDLYAVAEKDSDDGDSSLEDNMQKMTKLSMKSAPLSVTKSGSCDVFTQLEEFAVSQGVGGTSRRGSAPSAGSMYDAYAKGESVSAHASSGGHLDLSSAGVEPSLQSAREQWKEQESSLEESWSSLTYFKRTQKGRLANTMESEDINTEGDDGREVLEAAPAVSNFEIPTLPSGQQLIINILSTWGDKHYVGLNGIEIFARNGQPPSILDISADPADINILPGYNKDPRVVSNLIDGVYKTRDDMHQWLAPFTPGKNHFITILFDKRETVAIIRLWNYNKSRIHSNRGARRVEIFLDGYKIFDGEIARAIGGALGGTASFGDTILFTTDEDVLENISQFDHSFDGLSPRIATDSEDEEIVSQIDARPPTADLGMESVDEPLTVGIDTATVGNSPRMESTENVCGVLQFNFVDTWSDPHYLGLTGLKILGADGNSLELNVDMLSANPRDLNDLPEYDDDCRTIDKLVDGTTITVSDEHMWLIPFTPGRNHILTIAFSQKVNIIGFRIWNYNKSLEDTIRGAKIVHVSLDGVVVSPPSGFLLRKGPGNMHYDYGQTIIFDASPGHSPIFDKSEDQIAHRKSKRNKLSLNQLVPDYEPLMMPCGFVFKFELLSTWGDPYYIGLNGLELYDRNGDKIPLSPNNITAYPHSINSLEGITGDIRTPDKLIDGINDTYDGHHLWLAPVIPDTINVVYIVFDRPVTVSMIKLWNYSKTFSRGVKEFAVSVDDLLVFHGNLGQIPQGARGIIPTVDAPVPHFTILFTDDFEIAEPESQRVLRSSFGSDQDVQLMNDHLQVEDGTKSKVKKKSNAVVDQNLRPGTSVQEGHERKRHR